MANHNPFGNYGGDVFANGGQSPIVHTVRADVLAADRAIMAYRNNIAAPDIAIADRTVPYVPVVLGEDGQELTPERRAQLMRESGAKPMFNERGKLRPGLDYRQSFDRVIDTEELGRSAVNARPGYRVVRPREIELENQDYDDNTVESAEGATYVPAIGEQAERKVASSGHADALAVYHVPDPVDEPLMEDRDALSFAIRQAVELIVAKTGHGAGLLRINLEYEHRLAYLLKDPFFGLAGIPCRFTKQPGIRLLADPAYSRGYVQILFEERGDDDAE